MSTDRSPVGLGREAVITYIVDTYPETDVVTIEGGSFFSLDAEKHWPNYATVVWNDDFDQASDLLSRGAFRLNLGVSRDTFERLVGAEAEPDHRAFDRLLPHPVYARQHWISILNPTEDTFREVVVPLIAEAHDRLATLRARHVAGRRQPEA